MRVIAGSARGTKLFCPDGLSIRPTHDRVKEAVFSMLGDRVIGCSALDLFAGTGALGIEALSRGAEQVTFVDASPRSLAVAAQNVEKTHMGERSCLVQSDYAVFLNQTEESYDLIFLDPPYAEGFIPNILNSIARRNLLTDGGVIYCEFDGDVPAMPENTFHTIREKRYGRAHIMLLTL